MSFFGEMRCTLFLQRVRVFLNLAQVEYMVVVFNDKEKNARLSLRQTEILATLDAIVKDICTDCPCQYVTSGPISSVY
jgi:hypothetical protein